MPAHRLSAPSIDFGALRSDLGLPTGFPDRVSAEAAEVAAAPRLPDLDLTAIPFVTIDPRGARDLDQALHLERTPSGFRVRYAIADVAAFVRPGGELDAEAWRRGQTVYFPDQRIPLYPPTVSEGAASLLPRQVRPAAVWTMDLDAQGEAYSVDVRRALVRSTAQLDYETVQAAFDAGSPPEPIEALADVGTLRLARAAGRGAINLDLPDQEVRRRADGGWRLSFRVLPPVEEFNAQISLLAGECAAGLMLAGGVGLLRTLPPADPDDVEKLRLAAAPLGVAWPQGAAPGAVVAAVDRADPRGVAFLDLAAALLRGAAYTPFVGATPEQPWHAGVATTYAHVTAPLRRLADRYAAEICLALCDGAEVPDWASSALRQLPAVMAGSDRRSREVERAVLDLTESVLLADRVGEVFEAAVVERSASAATIVVLEPAVRATCTGDGLRLGTRIRARLTVADPAARTVRFEAVQPAGQ